MNKPYKIVVFDLDGTLVNSLYDLGNSVNKGLIKIGAEPHPIEKYKTFVGNGREKLIERAMGNLYIDEEKRKIVRDTFNTEYALHSNDNTEDYDGCSELLEDLKNAGILTAVLSNKPDEYVPEILKKIYPHHTFTEAWGQKPEYKCKPHKDSLYAMLKIHNINPHECLYVGDSDVDVFTAQNAGVDMVGVDWGFRGKEELLRAGAKRVVSKAEEIFKIAVGENE
ncbi:MAG: HAD-IA family hydrolase [Ruminococcus sp.]|nr:HAD-IA family hydrolase [Ruminococcus sp.]